MTESISQASSTPMDRDPPPHMEDSIFDKPTLEISDDLSPVSSPVFDDEVPDNLSVALYKTDKIPGLFALRHINLKSNAGKVSNYQGSESSFRLPLPNKAYAVC